MIDSIILEAPKNDRGEDTRTWRARFTAATVSLFEHLEQEGVVKRFNSFDDIPKDVIDAATGHIFRAPGGPWVLWLIFDKNGNRRESVASAAGQLSIAEAHRNFRIWGVSYDTLIWWAVPNNRLNGELPMKLVGTEREAEVLEAALYLSTKY